MVFCIGGSGKKIDNLIKELRHEDIETRFKAATALCNIGDSRAVEPLIAALKDENYGVRARAAKALGNIGDSQAVEPLTVALKDDDWFVRSQAAEALGNIGDRRAVEPLITALKDDDNFVRKETAIALAKIGDSRAVEPLIAVLKDDNVYVRSESLRALAKIGDSRAVEPLIAALNDTDRYVQMKKITSLEDLIVVRNGDGKDDDRNIRMEVVRVVVRALVRIGDKRVIAALVQALRDWYAGGVIASALEKLNWQPQSIENKVHYLVAKRDRYKLMQMWDRSKQILLKDIESNEYKVIENSLYAFIGIGKKEIIKDLITTLNREGTKTMAEAYLNCGNKELDDAARDWARRHGYSISTGPGAHPVGWGSWY
ncbi:MAG: heat repeat-containing PBS lyase [Candidatus Scalindua rubra]|uniref:Heat repeat-containing PBS lyase n=1 Tax=Candidatus Scalindua rubra TaxID=1872076 RepID=A0A1E3X4R6_9BACT|nr:MAG: heat repeat-containing PBS lyase [Candidatus Scalindua rubra]